MAAETKKYTANIEELKRNSSFVIFYNKARFNQSTGRPGVPDPHECCWLKLDVSSVASSTLNTNELIDWRSIRKDLILIYVPWRLQRTKMLAKGQAN